MVIKLETNEESVVDTSTCRRYKEFMDYQRGRLLKRVVSASLRGDLNGDFSGLDEPTKRQLEDFLVSPDVIEFSVSVRKTYCGSLCSYRETCTSPGKGR